MTIVPAPAIEIVAARPEDIPVLRSLVESSVRGLGPGFYSLPQIESALRYVFGIDSTLIDDRTYFIARCAGSIAGCGGWSYRNRLYGGDQHGSDTAQIIDPQSGAARIRAFFISPAFARQGIARRLFEHCLDEARRAGFRRVELMATLPGVPFYRQMGCFKFEEVIDRLPDGCELPCLRMGLDIA
jgi:GNAT superfamily N-acetyltransferase